VSSPNAAGCRRCRPGVVHRLAEKARAGGGSGRLGVGPVTAGAQAHGAGGALPVLGLIGDPVGRVGWPCRVDIAVRRGCR
jgi:hypothetical protein